MPTRPPTEQELLVEAVYGMHQSGNFYIETLDHVNSLRSSDFFQIEQAAATFDGQLGAFFIKKRLRKLTKSVTIPQALSPLRRSPMRR